MEKKLRNKRIRLIAIVLIVLAGIGFSISRLRVEPVDYKGSSEKSITEIDKPMQKIDDGKDHAETENKNGKSESESEEAGQPSDSQSDNKSHASTNGNQKNENSETGSGNSGGGNAAGSNGNNGSGNSGNSGNVGNGNDGNAGNGNDGSKEEDMITVYLSIDCYTLTGDGLSNLVDENLAKYVPANGEILKRTAYQCKRGTSVYDVLYHACRDKGIQMEASYTPLYSGYYVEGINYLYEFHGGTYSGWLYRVNDIFPNYGCSKYFLEEGDEIVWSYTCTEGDVPGIWM